MRRKFLSVITTATILFSLVMYFPRGVKAAAITSASDTMSRLQISITDVTHSIVFTPTTAINQDDGVQITIDTAFGDASLDTTDYSIAQAAGGTPCASWTENAYVAANDVMQFECDTVGAAGTGAITVSITTDLDNPASVASYRFTLETYDLGADGNFAGGDDVLEDVGYIDVPIVDDDTVNVTGYISTMITFDIDTSDTDEDCDAAGGANPCDSHSGASDNSGYVVDLGELTITAVNNSGDTVLHADGLTGEINSIYFNLSTNAVGGAVVTVDSLNGALDGPGANTIPSVTNDGNGVAINAGDGLYGLREVTNSATGGTFDIAGDYDGAAGTYGEATTTSTKVFGTSAGSIDGGRLELEIGTSPDALDGTGTYTDQLTFIATATF